MAKDLYNKVMQLCIKQLTTANTKRGLYKARYAKSNPKDEKSYQLKISKYQARKHIEALLKRDTYNNYNDIFRRLLISGQNRNMMPSVINFMEREQFFREALNDLNYTQIANNYPKDDEEQEKKLLKKLKNKITNIKDESIDNAKSLWRVYAKFIINAACFMQEKYLKYEKIETKDTIDIIKLATDIANNIPGMGFTLACDFLKEIGYDIAKPDLHILAFLEQNYNKRLKDKKKEITGSLPKDTPLEEAAAVKVMDDIAKESKCDIYALDKLIWLHCSGNYYEKKGKKETFDGIFVTPKSLQELFLAKI